MNGENYISFYIQLMNVGSKPSSISKTCDFVTNKNNMGFFIVITDIPFKTVVASRHAAQFYSMQQLANYDS